jgi:hypothetical protein
MYSGSAIFRQESHFYEFWYPSLKPYVHYIPISYDGSDVADKVEWARAHDDEVAQIATNAKLFAEKYLTDSHVACYWHRVLARYARLQQFKPVLTSEYKQVVFNASESWEIEQVAATEASYCDFTQRILNHDT